MLEADIVLRCVIVFYSHGRCVIGAIVHFFRQSRSHDAVKCLYWYANGFTCDLFVVDWNFRWNYVCLLFILLCINEICIILWTIIGSNFYCGILGNGRGASMSFAAYFFFNFFLYTDDALTIILNTWMPLRTHILMKISHK